MAASDEAYEESKVEAKPEAEAWRSGEAVLLLRDRRPPREGCPPRDWLKGLLGLFGARARRPDGASMLQSAGCQQPCQRVHGSRRREPSSPTHSSTRA